MDELPFRKVYSGKVRDIYELPPDEQGQGLLLLVASDRISAFDVVMPTLVPGKGKLLTEIAAWWFRFIEGRRICETHFVSMDVSELVKLGASEEAARSVEGRATIVRRLPIVPVECVVRGYLEGSGWKEYQETGAVSGVRLPKGLRRCERLEEPIFTPATKSRDAHDENITFEEACELIGMEEMGTIREVSLRIYREAAAHALERGIIIADTKFEFGVPECEEARAGRTWVQPVLADEALTPDSSRFWPVEGYEPGRAQRSFDKQYAREYLEELVIAGRWDRREPGPELPEEVVKGTLERYREARDLLCTD